MAENESLILTNQWSSMTPSNCCLQAPVVILECLGLKPAQYENPSEVSMIIIPIDKSVDYFLSHPSVQFLTFVHIWVTVSLSSPALPEGSQGLTRYTV